MLSSCRPFCYTNELLPLTSKHPSQLHLAPGLCTNREAHKSYVFMKNTEKKYAIMGFMSKMWYIIINFGSDWHTFGFSKLCSIITCVLNYLFTSLYRTDQVSTYLIWGYCVNLVKNTNRYKCKQIIAGNFSNQALSYINPILTYGYKLAILTLHLLNWETNNF